jgi:serine O-acetyltransferase
MNFDAALADVRARQPRFVTAVATDATIYAAARGERHQFHGRLDTLRQVLRLMWVADAFFAMSMYRAQARLDALRVPILPHVAKRLAVLTGQVCIGRTVLIRPGVYVAHGQVAIDGFTTIDSGVLLLPDVTIGSCEGDSRGPTIEMGARVGTGAKVFGDIAVRRRAVIGANAVVLEDVPAGATAVGVPARLLPSKG